MSTPTSRHAAPLVLAGCLLAHVACAIAGESSMNLTSTAFDAGQAIPAVHTCVGDDRSPALSWSGVPDGTKSLALVVDDPDAPDPAAPKRTWVHWVLYNIPPSRTQLDEGAGNRDTDPPAESGLNDWGRTGYGGPCPPIGRHRYFFKLFALDTVLEVPDPANKAAVERAMQGHVLAKTELIGTFAK